MKIIGMNDHFRWALTGNWSSRFLGGCVLRGLHIPAMTANVGSRAFALCDIPPSLIPCVWYWVLTQLLH